MSDAKIIKLEDDDDDESGDAYAAPTRVGPMSAAAVAKLMSDVDLAAANAKASAPLAPPPRPERPLSGVRPVPPQTSAELPKSFTADDEESSQPTVLNSAALMSAAVVAAQSRSAPASARVDVVGSIVDEMEASSLDDDDEAPIEATLVMASAQPPRPSATSVASAPVGGLPSQVIRPFGHSDAPSADPQVIRPFGHSDAPSADPQARADAPRAAFPEWIPPYANNASATPATPAGKPKLFLFVAVGIGVLALIAAAVVWFTTAG